MQKLQYTWLAFTTYPNKKTWQWCFSIAVIYALIAFATGIMTGFLRFHIVTGSWRKFIILPLLLLIQPSLIEEVIFRGLLLPYRLEKNSPLQIITKYFISLTLFIIYHPLIGMFVAPPTRLLFNSISFLIQTIFLGLTCTIVYLLSASIWPAILIHWVAVTIWILFFDGAKNIARAKWFQSR